MKISTDGIEGFADMTADQKVEALLSMEMPDPVDLSKFVKKEVFDAKASEASTLSKKLKEKMSDDEIARAQAEQNMKDLQDKYDALLESSTISAHTASYLAMPGYDEELAKSTAEALYAGDTAKVLENQKKAAENYAKILKAEWIKSTPTPPGSAGGNDKDEAVELARKIGKEKATSVSSTENILKHYM